MSEPATKDDIERIVELLQDLAKRMDERFNELTRNLTS